MATEEVATKKKAAEEAAAKKATKEAVAKKATKKARDEEKVVDQAVAKKRPQRRRRRRPKVVQHLRALAHLWLRWQDSRGRLRPVALHLWPSGASTASRNLGTLRDPSFVISCTTSVILFLFLWRTVHHPPVGCPLVGGPALRAQPKLLSPRTPSKPNRVTRLSVAARSWLLARLLPRMPPGRQPPVVGPQSPRCYQGVPLMSELKRWPLTILVARPMMAAPWSLRSSWGTPRLGPPGMSPSTRLWVQPARRLPRPRTCSTGRVVASSMNDGACCCGLPCSRSGQRWRGEGRRLGSSTLT
jgi:hypothetical protein